MYKAVGLGRHNIDRLRQEMQRKRERAERLYAAVAAVAQAGEQERAELAQKAASLYRQLSDQITADDEAGRHCVKKKTEAVQEMEGVIITSAGACQNQRWIANSNAGFWHWSPVSVVYSSSPTKRSKQLRNDGNCGSGIALIAGIVRRTPIVKPNPWRECAE